MAQCEDALDRIMNMQRPRKGKEGLGYMAKKKNNNKKKKDKTTQARKDPIVGNNATKGKVTQNDFAGITNPNYILYCDYYGDVYAKYVAPYVDFIAHFIWVPNTPVADKRGSMKRWVPKSKQ